MTFEQLEFFIASVECKTFLEGAECVNTSQSTLSKQIRKLEQELGVDLYDRSRRSARLTPAGQTFYQQAKKLTEIYRQTLDQMKPYVSGISSQLTIGTLPFLAQYDLTRPVQAYMKERADLQISVDEVEEPALLAGLENGTYDFIITRQTMIQQTDYLFSPVTDDTLAVMLPEAHPLASHASLSLQEIAQESFVLMNTYTSIYQLCQTLFKNANIHPRVLRTSRMESIISTVRLGQAISLFPLKNFRTFEHSGLAAVPLADAPQLIVGTACKKKNAAKMKRFVSFVQK